MSTPSQGTSSFASRPGKIYRRGSYRSYRRRRSPYIKSWRRRDNAVTYKGSSLMRGLNTGLPTTLNMKLGYYDGYQMSISGAPLYSEIRLNNPTDPIVSVGGHQPIPWDQMGTIYEHWSGYATKVEWSAYFTKANASDPDIVLDVGCRPSTSADGVPSNFAQFIEQPGTAVFQIPSVMTNEPKKCSSYIKNWEVLGLTSKSTYINDDAHDIPVQNTTYIVPNDKETRLVFGVSPSGATPGRMYFTFKVTYYGVFKNLKTLDPSVYKLKDALYKRYLLEQEKISQFQNMNITSPKRL